VKNAVSQAVESRIFWQCQKGNIKNAPVHKEGPGTVKFRNNTTTCVPEPASSQRKRGVISVCNTKKGGETGGIKKVVEQGFRESCPVGALPNSGNDFLNIGVGAGKYRGCILAF